MIKEYDAKSKVYGYGSNKLEAKYELQFNIARIVGLTDKWMKKRDEIYSWLPLNNMLSIKGLCSIIYEDHKLINTSNGANLYLEKEPLSHYTYLYYLLAPYVTFEDFTLTISAEVDLFLHNISSSFGNMSDFPITMPGNLSDAVDQKFIGDLGFWCRTHNNTIIVCNFKSVLEVPLLHNVPEHCIVSYGFAKMGIAYSKGKYYRVERSVT